METTTKFKYIVQLKTGLYVKDWQYSQGWFDVVETTDPLHACEIKEDIFDTFFRKREAKRIEIRVQADFKDVTYKVT